MFHAARSSQRQIEELQHKLAEMQERLQAAHRQTETAKNDKADLARQHQTALDAASRQGIQLQDQNQRAERELAEARERIASMELERKRQQEHNDNISSAFEQHLLECESHVCQLPESTNVVPEYETIPAEGSRAFQTELIVTEPSAATMARFLTLSSDRNGAVKKECLPLLFKLFTSEIPHIQLWAIEGFAQLLVSAVYRKPAFEMDCIPALAAVLLSTSSDVLYYALLALERLLTTESEASKVFCHSQTVHLIAGMLSSDGRVGPKAADVVYEVLGWEFGMSLLDESGALPALRTFVGSGSSVQNECVKKIAKKLAKFDRI